MSVENGIVFIRVGAGESVINQRIDLPSFLDIQSIEDNDQNDQNQSDEMNEENRQRNQLQKKRQTDIHTLMIEMEKEMEMEQSLINEIHQQKKDVFEEILELDDDIEIIEFETKNNTRQLQPIKEPMTEETKQLKKKLVSVHKQLHDMNKSCDVDSSEIRIMLTDLSQIIDDIE